MRLRLLSLVFALIAALGGATLLPLSASAHANTTAPSHANLPQTYQVIDMPRPELVGDHFYAQTYLSDLSQDVYARAHQLGDGNQGYNIEYYYYVNGQLQVHQVVYWNPYMTDIVYLGSYDVFVAPVAYGVTGGGLTAYEPGLDAHVSNGWIMKPMVYEPTLN